LFEQHSESFNICSVSTRINTEGKSLTMKLGPELDPITKLSYTEIVNSGHCVWGVGQS